MSSLLIKGMEMPLSGYVDVRIFCDGTATTADGRPPYYRSMSVDQLQPHGRLIDADALEHDFREDAKDAWNKEASPISWADAFDELADMVADAPTIIPADPAAEDEK